ncbi:sulfatase-like hydrolase/transferase [Gaetbulibacter saemankumensis]|uniref:sulfatase-like hydrolase/transferase n=1 Tax=Gaetbulibacter saemankumensis TaxID=311208 RepID=UPI0003F553AC|nr:sulfatase-like hydrolase/transferase [Gaetbulibacter saemankumensis]
MKKHIITTFKLSILICFLFGIINKIIAQNSREKPNVVVIITDDQGYADVGFQNLPASTQVLTPNLDRLAKSGVIFKNGYVAFSTCSPSRASLLTGRSSSRFGVEDNDRYIDSTELIIPRAIASEGYISGAFGKWHIGREPGTTPLDRGFDYYYGDLIKNKDYFMRVVPDPPCWLNGKRSPGENGRYITDAYTDEAITFIEKNKNEAFFAYIAYNAPHSPFLTTRQLVERVVSERPEWAPIYERMKKETKKWNGNRYSFGKFLIKDLDPDILRLCYISMLLAADDGVGKILDTLEKNNLRENTLIFYLSDNGAALARPNDLGGVNLPLRNGKGSVYDGGIRVPFVMSWPGVLKPAINNELIVSSMDIFSTTIALSGAQTPDDRIIDGVNIIPYLTGKKKGQAHSSLFFRRADRNFWSIRQGNYKWVYKDKKNMKSPKPNKGELYDIQNDISESRDLSQKLNSKRDELSKLYKQLTKDLPKPLPK